MLSTVSGTLPVHSLCTWVQNKYWPSKSKWFNTCYIVQMVQNEVSNPNHYSDHAFCRWKSSCLMQVTHTEKNRQNKISFALPTSKRREVQPEQLLQTRGTLTSPAPFFSVHYSLQLPCSVPGCAVTPQEMRFQLHPSPGPESSKSGCMPGRYSRSRKHLEQFAVQIPVSHIHCRKGCRLAGSQPDHTDLPDSFDHNYEMVQNKEEAR